MNSTEQNRKEDTREIQEESYVLLFDILCTFQILAGCQSQSRGMGGILGSSAYHVKDKIFEKLHTENTRYKLILNQT